MEGKALEEVQGEVLLQEEAQGQQLGDPPLAVVLLLEVAECLEQLVYLLCHIILLLALAVQQEAQLLLSQPQSSQEQ